jgi:tricorn protease
MHRLIRIVRFGLCAAAAAGHASGVASGQTKLLRFPDIYLDRVVFTYAGDLWTASSSRGTATRLTAHPGLELFAKFWPDGKWIAFTGQYDGDEQVYVVPATGGVPKQLTFYPARGPFPPHPAGTGRPFSAPKESLAPAGRVEISGAPIV